MENSEANERREKKMKPYRCSSLGSSIDGVDERKLRHEVVEEAVLALHDLEELDRLLHCCSVQEILQPLFEDALGSADECLEVIGRYRHDFLHVHRPLYE